MRKYIKSFVAVLVAITACIAQSNIAMAITTSSTITRSQVEQRASSMINLKWTYDASKNANIAPANVGYVTQPKQFNNQTIVAATGIPYNWGGSDGLDSASYNAPWTSFLDGISKGAYAGNVNTDAGFGYITGTAGIDCSGFIQASYNIQGYKLSTSTLFDKYFVKIDMSDIKHMDILDHPGDHVVMFDKWGTLNGVSGAFTYEATPDQSLGGIMGTKQYFISMNEINHGYIPGRYIGVVEEAPIPTPAPILVPQIFDNGTITQIVNVTTAANFRLAASTTGTIIGTIPKGTILSILGNSNGWYNVNYNGQTGWVYGNLIGAAPEGKYVTVNGVYQLNLRSSASGSAYIVGVLTQGQYALVIGKSADGYWTNISINGVQGWSASKYLK